MICRRKAKDNKLFLEQMNLASEEEYKIFVSIINHKSCFVPLCTNTTRRYENRCTKFFTVPKNLRKRQIWWDAVGRQDTLRPTRCHYYACEDHFDIEKDTKNWVRWKLMGGRLHLGDNVIPHKNIKSPSELSNQIFIKTETDIPETNENVNVKQEPSSFEEVIIKQEFTDDKEDEINYSPRNFEFIDVNKSLEVPFENPLNAVVKQEQ